MILLVVLAALVAGAAIVGSRLVTRSDPVLGVFERTGDMPQNWRFSVTQADGRVLVISPPGAARYDPSTGRFTEISSRLPESAEFGSATVLMDGRILVIGQGLDGRQTSTLFDPETGRAVDAGPTVVSRLEHVAVRLQDGRVLLAGGDPAQVGQLRPVQGAGGATATAELYDPATGTFTPTGDMARPRGLGATATLLADGRVLVAGGAGGGPDDLAELFDPTTGQFTPTGAMSEPRTDFTATLLDDGRVLFAGGYSTAGAPRVRRLATDGDIYDPATGTFSPTQPMVVPRFGHVAALLRDGRVLIAGGYSTGELQTQTSAAEIFDPSTGLFEPTSPLGIPRAYAGAAVLPSGDVLVFGDATHPDRVGQPSGLASGTAEIFR